MVDAAALQELRELCPGAEQLAEAGCTLISLPRLKLPCAPGVADALLAITQHSGYATRLFLSEPAPGKGTNWTVHQILGRKWHTWSWKDVSANLRPLEILRLHLRALR
jgi:hypothetical protein